MLTLARAGIFLCLSAEYIMVPLGNDLVLGLLCSLKAVVDFSSFVTGIKLECAASKKVFLKDKAVPTESLSSIMQLLNSQSLCQKNITTLVTVL